MADARVARRYAQALFGAAKHYDIVRGVEQDLDTIVGLMAGDATFRHFVVAPFTSREEKLTVFTNLFSDRVTALTMQALRVMLEKGREGELEAVQHEYVALRRTDAGIVYATVSSATLLPEDQKKTVVNALASKLGKKVEAEFKTEPSLIGGVRVTYANYVLDGSARGVLSKLRERLRYDLLKQI